MDAYSNPVKLLGEGTYGKVFLCVEQPKQKHVDEGSAEDVKIHKARSPQFVAIKSFKPQESREQAQALALREARLLAACKGHPNVVTLHHAYATRSGQVYLVQEYVPGSLVDQLRAHRPKGLPHGLVCSVIRQLLEAIAHMHSRKVMHRDIKVQNVLLTDEGQVKLCDFGMAASFGGRGSDCVLQTSHVDLQLTTYVITRWYRAPEVVLAEPYDEKVDVWSVGCLFTELLFNRPMFPGRSHIDQLALIAAGITAILPQHLPTLKSMYAAHGVNLPTIQPPPSPSVSGGGGGSTLQQQATLYQRMSEMLLPPMRDFLAAALHPDPARRASAQQLLALPIMSNAPIVAPVPTGTSMTPEEALEQLSKASDGGNCNGNGNGAATTTATAVAVGAAAAVAQRSGPQPQPPPQPPDAGAMPMQRPRMSASSVVSRERDARDRRVSMASVPSGEPRGWEAVGSDGAPSSAVACGAGEEEEGVPVAKQRPVRASVNGGIIAGSYTPSASGYRRPDSCHESQVQAQAGSSRVGFLAQALMGGRPVLSGSAQQQQQQQRRSGSLPLPRLAAGTSMSGTQPVPGCISTPTTVRLDSKEQGSSRSHDGYIGSADAVDDSTDATQLACRVAGGQHGRHTATSISVNWATPDSTLSSQQAQGRSEACGASSLRGMLERRSSVRWADEGALNAVQSRHSYSQPPSQVVSCGSEQGAAGTESCLTADLSLLLNRTSFGDAGAVCGPWPGGGAVGPVLRAQSRLSSSSLAMDFPGGLPAGPCALPNNSGPSGHRVVGRRVSAVNGAVGGGGGGLQANDFPRRQSSSSLAGPGNYMLSGNMMYTGSPAVSACVPHAVGPIGHHMLPHQHQTAHMGAVSGGRAADRASLTLDTDTLRAWSTSRMPNMPFGSGTSNVAPASPPVPGCEGEEYEEGEDGGEDVWGMQGSAAGHNPPQRGNVALPPLLARRSKSMSSHQFTQARAAVLTQLQQQAAGEAVSVAPRAPAAASGEFMYSRPAKESLTVMEPTQLRSLSGDKLLHVPVPPSEPAKPRPRGALA